MATNLVAIYDSQATADKARQALTGRGFKDVRLSRDNTSASRSSHTDAGDTGQSTGLFSWLIGSTDDADRSAYQASLHGDRTAVSVYAEQGREVEAEQIMEQFSPVEFDAHTGSASQGTAQPMKSQTQAHAKAGEEVIPIVKEQMTVGKQTEERRYRIRSYMVERPVEETVNLRDERVVIERRPATGTTASGNATMQPKEVEVIERHEKPVIGKTSKVEEEVVVHKDVSEHQEKVRGTVRETRVDTNDGRSAKH